MSVHCGLRGGCWHVLGSSLLITLEQLLSKETHRHQIAITKSLQQLGEVFQPAEGRFGMEGNLVVNFRNGCGCHTRFSLAGYFPRRRSAFLWRHSPNQTRPLSTGNQPSNSFWFSLAFSSRAFQMHSACQSSTRRGALLADCPEAISAAWGSGNRKLADGIEPPLPASHPRLSDQIVWD